MVDSAGQGSGWRLKRWGSRKRAHDIRAHLHKIVENHAGSMVFGDFMEMACSISRIMTIPAANRSVASARLGRSSTR